MDIMARLSERKYGTVPNVEEAEHKEARRDIFH